MEELEVAKKYLEYGVSPETVGHLDVEDLDLRESHLLLQSNRRYWKVLQIPGGSGLTSLLRRNHQSGCRKWKAISMGSFDFEDDPFRWIREEMD